MSDLAYFRDVQYRDSSKLAARANLHERYSSTTVPWHTWVVQQVEWAPGARVLEVGCGPGWLWASAREALPAALSLTLADLSVGMTTEALERAGTRQSHLVELDAVLVEVFGPLRREPYHERFGPHNGAPMLEPHFETLEWRAFEDALMCTDADDVLAYLLSYPPGEQADANQIASLRAAIVARIDAGSGAFRVTKEVGAFVCHTGVG